MEDNYVHFAGRNPQKLNDRELSILKLITMGKSNKEIAKELNLSEHTIKSYVCRILNKMSVDYRIQAAVKALRNGIIE